MASLFAWISFLLALLLRRPFLSNSQKAVGNKNLRKNHETAAIERMEDYLDGCVKELQIVLIVM